MFYGWFLAMALAALLPAAAAPAGGRGEIRSFNGQKLSPYHRDYDNSIKGPQKLDPVSYRLRLDGQAAHPRSLTYQEALKSHHERRVVLTPCVEGWSERLLVEGVLVVDLLNQARPLPGAETVVFHSADGYSTSLDLAYLKKSRALLAFNINGLRLDQRRGFPFQLIAEGKRGYKWAKWIVRIELRRGEYRGYWESRGYDNQADVKP